MCVTVHGAHVRMRVCTCVSVCTLRSRSLLTRCLAEPLSLVVDSLSSHT